MENLQNVIASLENAEIKLSGEKVNQTQRNEFKGEIQKALLSDLISLGLQATLTSEGIVLMIENDKTNLFVNIEATIKNLDFDLESAKQEFAEKQMAKLEREKSLKEKREKVAKEKTLKKSK